MTTSQTTASHIHRVENALSPLRRGNPPTPDVFASAALSAFGELVQALTDLAADIDAIAGRLDAVENPDQ